MQLGKNSELREKSGGERSWRRWGDLNTDAHFVPTGIVSLEQGEKIKAYIRSVANPTATIIQKGMKLGVQPSPKVAAFSSRGPNGVTPQLLKPDVIAPGVNILAAWTGALAPTELAQDKRRVNFNIISGTSMACPHVSGLAALIKSVHPKWSPAAIRSALVTTAYATYKNGETIQDTVTASPATPFDFGAGHVDPVAALHPGLVYDASVEDYIRFLCASNYTKKQIKTVTKRNFDCNEGEKKYSLGDLNYPSFSVVFDAASDKKGKDDKITTVTYTRTLTNVGGSPATYKVSVSKVESVKISVKPISLTFKKPYEKLTYSVTFAASSLPWSTSQFARLEWSDGTHVVGSPIAFIWL
ncbi:Peptidase S8, subtilisin-related [Trema orientale]|uniref:Peptidase S8, subtilisin-related n=1 Tax=Trema orientale TaxID=63057 RepID=A0A2P5EZW7_TREOI|nr:Peptidase S8, subtilisin-related [Trema orientale]